MIDGIPWDLRGARRVFKRRIMNERQVARNTLLPHIDKTFAPHYYLTILYGGGGQAHHQFSPLDNFSDKLLKQISHRLGSSFFRCLVIGLPFFVFDKRGAKCDQ